MMASAAKIDLFFIYRYLLPRLLQKQHSRVRTQLSSGAAVLLEHNAILLAAIEE
jgi:hypothetical protein